MWDVVPQNTEGRSTVGFKVGPGEIRQCNQYNLLQKDVDLNNMSACHHEALRLVKVVFRQRAISVQIGHDLSQLYSCSA